MTNNQQFATPNKKPKVSAAVLKRRKRHRKINSALIVVLLCFSLIIIGVFIFNIFVTANKVSGATGETLTVDESSSMKNDLYTIGNNPTELQRQEFQELTSAIKDNDPYLITEYVVKSFVADYFTWTNKDGNYEVGGLMYIYGPKFTAFQEQARYEFYSDLDLYINQYGRENLLEVTDIQTSEVVSSEDYYVDGNTYPSYYVEATWTYKNCKLDIDSFQNKGYFTVINRDGRYEIVSIYNAWDSESDTNTEEGGTTNE